MSPEQPAATELSDREWDVVIVGGGPAGSTAAAHLARQGHSVLVVEKGRYPRDKVCGDGLIADAIHCLERLQMLDEIRQAGHRVVETTVFSPARVEVPIAGEFITMKRRDLDTRLARRAAEWGAVLCEGEVTDVGMRSDGLAETVLRAPSAPRVRSRFVLIATGAQVHLARHLGLITQSAASASAVRAYVRSSFAIDRLVASYDRSIIPGYAWIFPVGQDVYNVGCIIFHKNGRLAPVNARTRLAAFLESFPLAQRLMDAGEMLSPPRGALLRCGLIGWKEASDPRILPIGETTGTTFPFTGEGIGKAMESAEIAAQVVSEALTSGVPLKTRQFPQKVQRDLGPRYTGYHIAERWLATPWMHDIVSRQARRSPSLRRAVAGIFNETVDPREVFSLPGLVRSLWS